jgi:hypothetical protein
LPPNIAFLCRFANVFLFWGTSRCFRQLSGLLKSLGTKICWLCCLCWAVPSSVWVSPWPGPETWGCPSQIPATKKVIVPEIQLTESLNRLEEHSFASTLALECFPRCGFCKLNNIKQLFVWRLFYLHVHPSGCIPLAFKNSSFSV